AIRTPAKGGAPVDTVIGQIRPYRIRKGDTLIDLARYYDLGYNEIVDANPAIDPWVPPVGATILLPTQWVLPCCSYDGLVVNIPGGVGMQVSHGCVRLYPEDIERLFPLVPVGAPGEFVYQPVKIGVRGGTVFVESHRDIYGYAPALFRDASTLLERAGVANRVDQQLLLSALEDTSGMPIRVSPEPADAG